MTPQNWIYVASLIIDLIKTIIPFVAIFFILWYFKVEIKVLLMKGQFKISAPGFSLETTQQGKEISKQDKKEIDQINKELIKAKKPSNETAVAIQKTAEEADQSFFLNYHFERTYRLIFPTQMAILIAARQGGELTEEFVQGLFKRTIWFQTYGITYEQFSEFLFNAGIMMKNKNMLKVTPLGNLFLEYLRKNNIPTKLPATDQIHIS